MSVLLSSRMAPLKSGKKSFRKIYNHTMYDLVMKCIK